VRLVNLKSALGLLGACCLLLLAAPVQALEVTELKLPSANKVVIKVRFRNGSIADPAQRLGLTYATANLMTQGGAGGRGYAEIQDILFPWAASYNALVDKEVTTFTFRVPADFAEDFYPIVRDVLLAPNFDQADFTRVMKQQQNFVDQVIRASSDEDYSKMALEHLLFRGGNMAHMKQGNSATVAAITRDEVKAHYQAAFTRHNVSLGIAGNYSEEFLARLKEDLGRLPETEFKPATPSKANRPEGIVVEIIAKDGAFGSAIFTGAPLTITRKDDEFAALMIANSWMGEHRKSYSRLYQLIREQRSMNYGDYAYIEWYQAGGQNQLPPSGVPRSSNYWSIWIRPVQIAKQLKAQYEELADIEVGHAHFALRMALREFDQLIENGMDPAEFEATRTFLRSYTKLYAQSPEDQLGWLMDSKFYGRLNYLAELDTLLANATLEQVNAAIRKHWQTDDLYVVIVTDTSEAQPLADSLIGNKPSPMSYSNLVAAGLPEELKAVDAEVATYPLNVKKVDIIQSSETFK
jgi:zinc protease